MCTWQKPGRDFYVKDYLIELSHDYVPNSSQIDQRVGENGSLLLLNLTF